MPAVTHAAPSSYVSLGDSGPFEALPLETRARDGGRQLAVAVPDALGPRTRGIEYYADARGTRRSESDSPFPQAEPRHRMSRGRSYAA